MKTKLSILFVAVMASVCLLRAEVYSGTCGANLTWSLNTIDSTLTISGTGAMNNYGYKTNQAPWRTYSEYVKYVIINEGVTNIGNYAIYGCGALTSATIPNSVTSIDNYAFCMCKALEPVTIPTSVTSIGTCAFANCWGFTSIEIPCSVKSIGSKAFYDCPSLRYVTIGDSVTSIGSNAFEGCRALKSVTIPASVIRIGTYAFCECTGLKSVTIPASVTSIGDAAFYRCLGLQHVINYNETPLSIPAYVFRLIKSGCTLYVPAESINLYKNAPVWNVFTNIQPINMHVTDTVASEFSVASADSCIVLSWPVVENADTYTIEVKDNEGNVVCILLFNAQGELQSLQFAAPSRNGDTKAQTAEQTYEGWQYVLNYLNPDNQYSFRLVVTDTEGGELYSQTINSMPTAIESTSVDTDCRSKILRDGQIVILRGENVYTVTGQEVR